MLTDYTFDEVEQKLKDREYEGYRDGIPFEFYDDLKACLRAGGASRTKADMVLEFALHWVAQPINWTAILQFFRDYARTMPY